MSNREIEDVLSSIRRLVSDDLRPASKPPATGTPQADQPTTAVVSPGLSERTADKLLLTPDFRVQKAQPPQQDAVSEPVAEPKADITSEDHRGPEGSPAKFDIHDHYEWLTDPDKDDWYSDQRGGSVIQQAPADSGAESDVLSSKSPLAAEASAGIEDVVSRLGAAVQATDDEWEAPMGDADVLSIGQKPTMDDGAITAPELTFVPRARSQAASFDAGPSSDAHATQGASGVMDDQDDADSHTLVTPDGDAASYTGASADPDPISDADHPIHTDDAIDTETETEDDAFSTSGYDPAEYVDPIPKAVPPFARRIVTPPDAGEADWADAAEAAVMEDLARDVEREAADLFDEPEVGMTFDEDVLRDLVRDIIREELAGTLGERITRNVRKLVRAEIARALAVREFE